MRNKLQQFGLIVVGVLAGVMISLNFSAVAQKGTAALPLPTEEKSVKPVEKSWHTLVEV